MMKALSPLSQTGLKGASGNRRRPAAAQTYADGLNTAMDTRVDALEGDSHVHTNKDELDLIQSGDVAKWNAAYSALTIDGNDVD
jgi:hypothetical protein